MVGHAGQAGADLGAASRRARADGWTAEEIRRVVARYGLGLQIAGTARERVPVRRARRIAFARPAGVLAPR